MLKSLRKYLFLAFVLTALLPTQDAGARVFFRGVFIGVPFVPLYYPIAYNPALYYPPPYYPPPPPAYYPAQPYYPPQASARPYPAYNQHADCRQYSRTAVIGGQNREIYGHACHEADGRWRIID